MAFLKNTYVMWHGTQKLATFDDDTLSKETISETENPLQNAINKVFDEFNYKELQVCHYDENGGCTSKNIINPNYKDTFVFTTDVNVLGIFNSVDIARQKLIDWFSYHYTDEFEKDEIELIVDELMSSSEFAIDNDVYQFSAYTMNKC